MTPHRYPSFPTRPARRHLHLPLALIGCALASLSCTAHATQPAAEGFDRARTAVAHGAAIGETLPAALKPFADFRQFPQYQATFADNLRAAAVQYREEPAKLGASNGFRRLRRLSLGKNPHQIAFSPDARWAYIAIAGDDRIARVDVAALTPAGAMAVTDAPLGVHALATDDLLVTRFGGEVIERRHWGEAEASATLPSGIGTSLFSDPLPDGSLLASVERSNTLLRFARDTLAPIASFTTGARPFPPAATSDGRLAFVPNYDDGSVSVFDLWNGTLRATVAVGGKPSGGAVLPGDGEYAVAVRGEDRIAFINTASKQVVGALTDGIGQSPFSVVLAPNGRLAFVNNTASHDVSVIALPEKRVIARIPTGEIPIVMAVHPSGETLWVSCEGSHTLDIIAIPRVWREPTADAPAPGARSDVAVLGMIHGAHRTSTTWSLDAVRDTITRFDPDVVIAEIAPDRWQRIVWRDTTSPVWQHSQWAGNVTEYRVKGISKDNVFFGVQAVDHGQRQRGELSAADAVGAYRALVRIVLY